MKVIRKIRYLFWMAFTGLALAMPLQAQLANPTNTASTLTDEHIIRQVTEALDRAMEYLASKQRPDGGWVDNNAANGLALLAFMGRGHTPGHGPYRDVLERGKRFMLSKSTDAGFLGISSMYEHGLSTLALAEMYGMDPDPELETKLRKAVNLIIKCQSSAGGWRYNPVPGDQDMSVSIMQIVALRAANNAEIPVPSTTLERAITYVRSCAAPQGGFGYSGPGYTPQMTAAGTLALQLLGKYDDPAVAKAVKVLSEIPVKWSMEGGLQYFYYFHYYAIQANYQAGGKAWSAWHHRVRTMLLEKQNQDGSWNMPDGDGEEPGRVGGNKIYWTAMASLIIEIYMHYLPAYQR